jgi:hypothetical protein
MGGDSVMGKVRSLGYFPHCMPQGIPTPTDLYLELTLGQAMALFWRVKNWEFKTTGTLNATYDITYLGSSWATATIDNPVSSEEQLVCKGEDLFTFTSYVDGLIDDHTNPPYTLNGIRQFSFSFGSDVDYGAKYQGSTYYPLFSFQLFGPILSTSLPGYPAVVGTYYLSFLDYLFEGDLYGAGGVSGNVEVEINAKEYWSYGGTYNTETGEKIQ